MIQTGERLYVERSPWMPGPSFYLIRFNEQFQQELVHLDGTSTKIDNYESRLPPTFRLPLENVQELFDSLYAMGYRPTRPVNDDSSQSRHLEDMRRIAFMFLDNTHSKPAQQEA